jgi:NAD(P)-dependent dehydrogenase (short-subunit alcohol dehydrogenase family)
MRVLRDRVAVVTGAASGIGRALAVALAREGAHLALGDVDEAGLAETCRLVADAGVRVTSAAVDVSRREAVFAHAERVVGEHGRVNLVVNNAGVALSGTIEELALDEIEWLMGTNFWGVVYGTKAFLPHLKRADEGHVVNVSSVFGLVGIPGQGAYNAAKFAVRGFTECLRQELELEGANVSATCVHPGGIRTNIARAARVARAAVAHPGQAELAARFEALARTTPDTAARAILRGVARNARRVLIGRDAWGIDLMQRLTATGYQALVVRQVRRSGARPL